MSNNNKFFSFGRVSVGSSLFVNGEVNVQNGRLTVGSNSSDASIVAQGSGSIIVPVGSTAERPAASVTGMVRFNSTTNAIESYNPGRDEWASAVTASYGDFNVDTVKFDLTDEDLDSFGALEGAFGLGSDLLPAEAVIRAAWGPRTTPESAWTSVVLAFSQTIRRFVAVGTTTSTRVMFSNPNPPLSDPSFLFPVWTGVVLSGDLLQEWTSVAFSPELGRLAAVARTGVGVRVMTSDDFAQVWASRSSSADNEWTAVVWASELALFVAVAASGEGNRVMTSADGIVWANRASAADISWAAISWAPELSLLVAVANTGAGNRVMVSSDGISWDTRPSAADSSWSSIAWSGELGIFVAVASGGGSGRVMTSYDGQTWVLRSSPALSLTAVVWVAELGIFVALASGTTQSLYSADGIEWYLAPPLASSLQGAWTSLAYDIRSLRFAAVRTDGSPQQAMVGLYSSAGKWGGGCLSKNNEIYFVPSSATNVLVYDTVNRSARIIDLIGVAQEQELQVGNKWIGSCRTPTDLVIAAPFNAKSILVIDSATDAIAQLAVPQEILDDATAQNSYWNGCATTPASTLVYFAPGRANRVLTLDFGSSPLVVGSIALPAGIAGSAGLKFNAIALGADRNVYLFPRDLPASGSGSGSIVRVNTGLIPNTLSAQAVSFPLNIDGSHTNLYFGAVLGPDRRIYVMPLKSASLLEFDPATGAVVFHALPASPLVGFGTEGVSNSSPLNWVNAILGQNGKVYGIPFRSRAILEFDPITKLAAYIPVPNYERFAGTVPFFGAVMGPDNSLYFVPRDANVIAEMSFIKGNAYKSWMLSPFFNHC